MLTRRQLLVGGAASLVAIGSGGFVGVEHGWLPGRVALGRALGRCDVDADVPADEPGELVEHVLSSRARGCEVTWILALPPGVASSSLGGAGAVLPMVLALHGRGGDAHTAFASLGLHHFLAQHVNAGGAPFALVSVDGGDTYWHPRASGDDPLGMIATELLPLLDEAGLRTEAIGVLGWSMGGYGALVLARQSGSDTLAGARIAAVAAESPALFESYDESAPGAFDDAADFDAWGRLAEAPGVSTDTALMVSCGNTDAFTDLTRRYRAAITPSPAGGIDTGCHDNGYWRSQAAAQLTFLGPPLAALG